jgi:hypothetical protein
LFRYYAEANVALYFGPWRHLEQRDLLSAQYDRQPPRLAHEAPSCNISETLFF